MKDRLLAYLEQGATIITPTPTLSQEVLKVFFQNKAKKVKEKPKCLSYSAFLTQSFTHAAHDKPEQDFPVLLSPNQSRLLTQICLQNLSQSPLNQGVIDELLQAFKLCHTLQLNPENEDFSLTQHCRQLQYFWRYREETLKSISAITPEHLVDFFIKNKILFKTKKIVWYCFDEYTQEQKHLQVYLREQEIENIELESFESDPFQKSNAQYIPTPLVYAAKDEEDEFKQIIAWIKAEVAAGKKRLGLVLSDLKAQAPKFQRLLKHQMPDLSGECHLAKPLSELPLIEQALSFLEFGTQPLNLMQARLLLYSPYLAGSKTEMQARMLYLEQSPIFKELIIEKDAFLISLKDPCPELHSRLTELEPYPEKTDLWTWLAIFHQRLSTLGFPGDYALSKDTTKIYQDWLGLLDEFSTLHLIQGPTSATQALNLLKDLAANKNFCPKQNSPLEILSLEQASGAYFDGLWLSGLSDERLPAKTRTSAFIPLKYQEGLAEQAWKKAAKLLTRLSQTNLQCILSYPRLSEDKPNLPSPLLRDFPSLEPRTFIKTEKKVLLEAYTEEYSLPFREEEKCQGSADLIANQAKCPFRALAAHRLHGRKMPSYSDGLSPAERGQVLHRVMEVLWQSLKDQTTLFKLNEEELNSRIKTFIESSLKPFSSLHPHSFPPLLQEVEKKRLHRLVTLSLNWEKKRPPFKIQALEQRFELHLGSLCLHLRIDRLDLQDEGKKAIIDYKTNLPQSLPWVEERPKEPQLLLYALLDEEINTLLYVELKKGSFKLKGVSDEELPDCGQLKEPWSEARQRWQNTLNEIALEYSSGYCPPKPLQRNICQNCDYQTLCRFNYVNEPS